MEIELDPIASLFSLVLVWSWSFSDYDIPSLKQGSIIRKRKNELQEHEHKHEGKEPKP